MQHLPDSLQLLRRAPGGPLAVLAGLWVLAAPPLHAQAAVAPGAAASVPAQAAPGDVPAPAVPPPTPNPTPAAPPPAAAEPGTPGSVPAAAAAEAAEPLAAPLPHRRAHRGQAWVVAANPLAADAGLEILRQGGTAVDAAVAVQAMLGLVEPQSSGVAGGAFLMYYEARSGHVTALDGREKAPAGATPGMFLDEHGKPLSYVEAVRSGRSTGVPGVMAMLHAAQARYGALHWRELFQPAIRAATEGFRVPQRLASFLGEGSPFPPTSEVRALFARPDGESIEEGDLFHNPDYARTLTLLSLQGPAALYKGAIAQELVKVTSQPPLPGNMTLKDLASYRAEWVDPLCRPYRGYSVCVPPPPASGVSLLELLGMLEKTDFASRGPDDPRAWFEFAQASRLMYADRDHYVADPHSVPVPVARLLDPGYLRLRAQLIGEHTGPAPQPGAVSLRRGADGTQESAGTSHFVVVDADGNVVSMTTTVESVFGSGRVVGGFVLNNQLTDFSFVPTEAGRPAANAVQGGKRPRSSMAPVIVLDHEHNFVLAVGSPGGSAILDYNAKAVIAVLTWKLSLKQAIELPNLIARGDTFTGELAKFPPAVLAGLRERGMELKSGRAENSGFHGVLRHADGSYEGAADSRREGVARMLPPRTRADAAHAAVH